MIWSAVCLVRFMLESLQRTEAQRCDQPITGGQSGEL